MPEPTAETIRIGKLFVEVLNLPEEIVCAVCGAVLQETKDEGTWVQLHRADPQTLPKQLYRLSRRRLPSSC